MKFIAAAVFTIVMNFGSFFASHFEMSKVIFEKVLLSRASSEFVTVAQLNTLMLSVVASPPQPMFDVTLYSIVNWMSWGPFGRP